MVHRRLRLLLQLRAEVTKTAQEIDAEIERELHALAEQEALRRRRQFRVIALPGAGLAIGAAIAALRALFGLGGRKAVVGAAAFTLVGATAVTLTLLPNHRQPPGAAPDPGPTSAATAEPSLPRATPHRSYRTPAQPPGVPDETPVDRPDEPTADDDSAPTVKARLKVTRRRVVPRPLRAPLRAPLRPPDEAAPRQDWAPRHLLPTGVFGVDLP